MSLDPSGFGLSARLVKIWSGIVAFVRAWEDATPMASRQLAVWMITPVFGVGSIACLIVHGWGGAAICGVGFLFGAWRCWRLPTPTIRRLTRSELGFAGSAGAVVAVVILIGHATGRI
jgi:hypothetical protein